MRHWQVRDVMTTDVVATQVGVRAEQALDTLDHHQFSAMPVVDSRGRVLGVVSRTDLLPSVRSTGNTQRTGSNVEELMTVPAWTVAPETTLSVAAKRMQTEKIKRLPVTGDAGRLVGILSATDLLRVFGRLDKDIRHEVLQELRNLTKWIDREPVHVIARAGVVTLAGTVDRRSTVVIAERLTCAVPGVVSVINRLDFEYDDTAVICARNHEDPPNTVGASPGVWQRHIAPGPGPLTPWAEAVDDESGALERAALVSRS